MLLSILVPALKHRPWELIVNELHAQAASYPDEVEILVDVDGGEDTSGVKRQRLAVASRGEYRAFVDDDDTISPDYLASLVEGCRSNPDVVTFWVRYEQVGEGPETWRMGLHGPNRVAGFMSANHLCAWKASIADKVAWCSELGYADDQLWYKPLVASGFAETEWSISRHLYTYKFDRKKTVNQTPKRAEASLNYFGSNGLDCFIDDRDGEILIQVGGKFRSLSRFNPVITVRDRFNRVSQRDVASMRKIANLRAD